MSDKEDEKSSQGKDSTVKSKRASQATAQLGNFQNASIVQKYLATEPMSMFGTERKNSRSNEAAQNNSTFGEPKISSQGEVFSTKVSMPSMLATNADLANIELHISSTRDPPSTL